MKIIFDVDGVFADFVRAFNEAALNIYPGCLENIDVVPTDWNWSTLLYPEQVKTVLDALPTVSNFWMRLRPYMNVESIFTGIKNLDLHDIYFVTNRFDTPGISTSIQTRLWISEILGLKRCQFSVVVVGSNPVAKAQFARAVGAQVSIDDKPENVRALAAVPGHQARLLTAPWNMAATDLDNFRVASVGMFLHDIGMKF